jgi:hypothetical protein
VIYLKSILAGVAAFVVTVIISSAAAISFMTHYPQLAQRIFSAQPFDIQWGAFYEESIEDSSEVPQYGGSVPRVPDVA